MGCDIHLYVERRTDGGWEHVPSPGGDDYYRTDKWYDGRNYVLFAILAGVRNRHDVTPISEPRGLPADASDHVLTEDLEWGPDGHDHTYLTVGEVLGFDWDQLALLWTLVHDRDRGRDPRYAEGGFAEEVQRFALNYHELPPWAGETCAGVSGPSEHLYERVTWTQPYYRCADRDWWGTVTRAVRLSKGSLDDVRFVFWFDN